MQEDRQWDPLGLHSAGRSRLPFTPAHGVVRGLGWAALLGTHWEAWDCRLEGVTLLATKQSLPPAQGAPQE